MIELQPKMLVIESVPQALDIPLPKAMPNGRPPPKARQLVDPMARDAMKRGYSVSYVLLDGGWAGLPQSRKRFFFIAHRHRLDLRPFNWSPIPTVGETLHGVKDPGWRLPTPKNIEGLYQHMQTRPNGRYESLRVTWCRLHNRSTDSKLEPGIASRPMFMWHRLHPKATVGAFGGNYWFHPDEERFLGINEILALNGYPEDYRLTGRPATWCQQIAQAVLPPVGDWIGASALRTIQGKRVSRPQVTEIDLRLPPGRMRDLTEEVWAGVDPIPATVEEIKK